MISSEPLSRAHAQAKSAALVHGALGVIWLIVGLAGAWREEISRDATRFLPKTITFSLEQRAFLFTLIGGAFFLPCLALRFLSNRVSDDRRWPLIALLALSAGELVNMVVAITITWCIVYTARLSAITTLLLAGANIMLLPLIASCLSALPLTRRQSTAMQSLPVKGATRALARRTRLHECKSCGHRMRSPRWLCPRCGSIVSAWKPPAGMMSDFARRRAAQVDPANSQPLNTRDRDSKLFAARFVIRHAALGASSASAEECLDNPRLLRRLYLAAAKRLHPDRNEGRHRDEWFQLQQAAAILKA